MTVQGARSLQVPAGVPVGALATLGMDAAMLAAARYGRGAFSSDLIGPEVIGRWAAGLMRGRWRHDDIMTEPRQRGELGLGILTHYATGVALAQVFLTLARSGGRNPTLLEATGYGVATSVLPLLVLFPSLGYGWLGLRSGDAARIDRAMLLGHVAFGLGIGLWASRLAPRHDRRRD